MSTKLIRTPDVSGATSIAVSIPTGAAPGAPGKGVTKLHRIIIANNKCDTGTTNVVITINGCQGTLEQPATTFGFYIPATAGVAFLQNFDFSPGIYLKNNTANVIIVTYLDTNNAGVVQTGAISLCAIYQWE